MGRLHLSLFLLSFVSNETDAEQKRPDGNCRRFEDDVGRGVSNVINEKIKVLGRASIIRRPTTAK